MVATLGGIAFQQVYGDNTGTGAVDTDRDGTITQEDEFVSFINLSGAPVDISGWQVWSDSQGTNGIDAPQDGLYHTFAPGTVLQPGDTLFVINEFTGTPGNGVVEASQGGMQSGAGGNSTNLLTEGDADGSRSESVVLVNPATGQYLVFNMAAVPSGVPNMSGFPGTTKIGEIDGHSIQGDQNQGQSYQYSATTDSYTYGAVMVPCFAAGTRIDTPSGPRRVEDLRPGDAVITLDDGPQPIRFVLFHTIRFDSARAEPHRPVEIRPGALGPGRPHTRLRVSPHHRMLVAHPEMGEILVPAKALLGRWGVRVVRGVAQVSYVHLVFDRHQIVLAEGCPSESFLARGMGLRAAPPRLRPALSALSAGPGGPPAPARTILPHRQALRLLG
jgi:hypothetical protein